MKIEFTVYGNPVGKGRPRGTVMGKHVHMYTPQKTRDYEEIVRTEYIKQCNKRFDDVALYMGVRAFYPIPKTINRHKVTIGQAEQMRNMEIYPMQKPDIDNVIKSITDALLNIAYSDDKQIVSISAQKYYSDTPRVEITISEVPQGRNGG